MISHAALSLESLLQLQMPGGPELVVIALILLPLLILALIGVVLVRRILDLPDPSRVNAMEREVAELRERVRELEDDGNEGRETGREDD